MHLKTLHLGKITNNLDGKRIPLNSQQRMEMQENARYPYIGANNIMGYVNQYIFDEKILCLAEDGGSWGRNEKCAIIFNEKCWVNNHAHVLTAKDGLHLEYLRYYLNYADLTSFITGTTRGKLTKSALNSIPIPLPPLPVQRAIAERLDRADALRQKDRQLLQEYDALAQSVFVEMFGDPVRNEKGWEVGTIRDVAAEVKYGTSKPAEENGAFPYLRMNNITYNGDWDFSSLKYINLSKSDEEKFMIKKGDLVFNRTNSKELVGKSAVYRLDEPMVIAGYLIRVRTNEKALPDFVCRYLNSGYGKAILSNMCKNIIGMANINAQELQDIKIFIPPIDLQNRFAEILTNIEQQKALVRKQQAESEALFGRLLQEAFAN